MNSFNINRIFKNNGNESEVQSNETAILFEVTLT